jgi:hypothetical protein
MKAPKKIKQTKDHSITKTCAKGIMFFRHTGKYTLSMKIDGEVKLIGEFDDFRQAFLRKNEIEKNKGV